MRLCVFAGLAAALAITACSDVLVEPPEPPLAPTAAEAVVDGRDPDGTAGFYFLPPLAPAADFSGEFDPAQEPVVEVCTGTAGSGACDAVVARFELENRGGPVNRLVVIEEDEHYALNWGPTGVEVQVPYRVRVLVGSQLLGELDFMFFDGHQRRAIPAGTAAVSSRSVVVVRFRIEVGAVQEGGPDLVVASVVPDGLLTLGVATPVVVEIRNDGSVVADDVSFLLEALDGADAAVADLGTHTLPSSVAADGALVSHTVDVIPTVAWGGAASYVLRATVDPSNTVAELDETNNVGAADPAELGAPDLAVTAVSMPDAVRPNETVSLSATLSNVGNRDAGAFTVEWTVTDAAEAVSTFATLSHAGLAAGASDESTASLTVDPSWTGPLTVEVAVSGPAEFETSNNAATSPPIEIELVDLAPAGPPVLPESAVLQCEIPVSAEIENLQNGTAEESVTRFRLLDEGTAAEIGRLDIPTPPIAGGESVALGGTFVVDGSWPAGVRVEVTADADGVIEETDVTNNSDTSEGAPTRVLVAPPTGFSKLWICGSDSDWSTSGNWEPVGAPVPSDRVFVPTGASVYPILAVDATVEDLTVEENARVDIASRQLRVTGSLVSSLIEGQGNVILDGAQGRGILPNLVVSSSSSLSGDMGVTGDVLVPFGGDDFLDINGHELSVGGGLELTIAYLYSPGGLLMTVPGSQIDVEGDVHLAHLGLSDLSEGRIRVGGNFRQSAAGANGGVVVFDGTAPQTASWTSLHDVVVAAGAEVTQSGNSVVTGRLTVDGGRILRSSGSIAYTTHFPRVLAGSYEVVTSAVSGTVTLDEDVTLAHPSAGVLVPYGGDDFLDINGHKLFVGGGLELTISYSYPPGGLLMTVPGSEIEVEGDVRLAHLGLSDLSEGRIRVGGNFLQSAAGANGGVVVFDGTAPQTASWTSLHDVVVVAGAEITQSGNSVVTGRLTVDGGRIIRTTGSLAFTTRLPRVLSGSYEVVTSAVRGTVVLDEDVTLAHPSAGVFVVHGSNRFTLDINGYRLFVGGRFDLRQAYRSPPGVLLMDTPGSELEVEGDAVLRLHFSQLAGARLFFGGGLDQAGGSWAGSEIIFDGTAAQAPVLRSTPEHVRVDNPAGVRLPSSISGQLRSTAGVNGLLTGSGATFSAVGLAAQDLTLDNAPLQVNGGAIGTVANLTFRNMSDAATQLRFRHPGSASTIVLDGLTFTVTPTTGLYLLAEDTAADANTLELHLTNSSPADGSAFTATSGGAVVVW